MSTEIETGAEPNKVPKWHAMKQFLFIIRKPIIVAASVNLLCSFAPISLIATLRLSLWMLSAVNFIATTLCLIWVGQIAYRNIKPSIVHASLSGPTLAFFSIFLTGLLSSVRYISDDWVPPESFAGTLLDHQFFVILFASIGGFMFLFPITMGVAALGAAFEKRKQNGQRHSNQTIKADEDLDPDLDPIK